jgi:hypothetical protein
MKRISIITIIVLILALALAQAVVAAPAFAPMRQAASLAPDELATLLLGFVGIALQLVFRYVPKVSDWYQALENKGLWMLGFVVLSGVIYFGLSCTPLAGDLGIQLSCTLPDAYLVLKAIFIVAMSQSLTFLYTKPNSPKLLPKYVQ